MWKFPWGYAESFMVATGLITTGLLISLFTGGNPVSPLVWPFNLLTIIFLIFVITLSQLSFSRYLFVQWLASIPAAISAMSAFGSMVLLLGLFPQIRMEEKSLVTVLGLNHFTESWPFILAELYVLVILGNVIVKKIRFFHMKDQGFVCSHLGLWIAVTAGTLGAGDLKRWNMYLEEGQMQWVTEDHTGKIREMPVALQLEDFIMEEYPPNIVCVSNSSGEVIKSGGKDVFQVEKHATYRIHGWDVTIKEFFSESGKIGGRYVGIKDIGAAPSAYVEALHPKTGQQVKGWISCGSFVIPPEALKINDSYSLAMTFPEPEKFISRIRYFTKEGNEGQAILEVNSPLKLEGWEIYQLSYDEVMGKYSTLSVVEFVKDPWLPVVYAGIFLMVAGAVYMFWAGNKHYKVKKS